MATITDTYDPPNGRQFVLVESRAAQTGDAHISALREHWRSRAESGAWDALVVKLDTYAGGPTFSPTSVAVVLCEATETTASLSRELGSLTGVRGPFLLMFPKSEERTRAAAVPFHLRGEGDTTPVEALAMGAARNMDALMNPASTAE